MKGRADGMRERDRSNWFGLCWAVDCRCLPAPGHIQNEPMWAQGVVGLERRGKAPIITGLLAAGCMARRGLAVVENEPVPAEEEVRTSLSLV
jgi:hypothetical protein